MLVCHCHALTDRDIRRAVRCNGAYDVEQVGEHCGAATGCGGCHDLVAEIVQNEKHRLTALTSDGRPSSGPGPAQVAPDFALTG
jgi:bacterioferritin-associated ferredoxin